VNEQLILEKVREYTRLPPTGRLEILTDTTEFMTISAGTVLELEGRYYVVRGDETEGRFGLDGEPKYWVKRAIDLADGSHKVIKLVFHESFLMHLGTLEIRCFRSPQKEGRILGKIRNDPHFMQGLAVKDSAGNEVRILDRIRGSRFYDIFDRMEMDHETYFRERFPEIFSNVLDCIEAIGRLHHMNELHGDIRNDHIIIDRKTRMYTWIDFDYTHVWTENPFGVDLFGLGNVLLFTVGMGFHNLTDLKACAPPGMRVSACLGANDFSLLFPHRVINLQKLFPHIPDQLNHVLLHFSRGAEVFYERTEELLEDLRSCEAMLPS